MAAATSPTMPASRTATRPDSQTANRTNNTGPPTGGRPVQFGMAVSRKPATIADPYPKRSSWECHTTTP